MVHGPYWGDAGVARNNGETLYKFRGKRILIFRVSFSVQLIPSYIDQSLYTDSFGFRWNSTHELFQLQHLIVPVISLDKLDSDYKTVVPQYIGCGPTESASLLKRKVSVSGVNDHITPWTTFLTPQNSRQGGEKPCPPFWPMGTCSQNWSGPSFTCGVRDWSV